MNRAKLHPLELFADVAWEAYCPVMTNIKTAPVVEGMENCASGGGFH
jgi:hypothetical protein